MKKLLAALLTALLLALEMPALAAEKPPVPVDPGAEITLTVRFTAVRTRDGEALRFAGAEVCLYRVAELRRDGTYAVPEAFAPCCTADLNTDLDADALRTLANTMKAQVYEAGLAPDAAEQTDPDGCAVFAGLEPGLYLLFARQPGADGRDRYIPAANLISLPTASADGSAWNYAPETKLKYTFQPAPVIPVPPVAPPPVPTPGETPPSTPTPEETPNPTPTPEAGVTLTAHKLWDDAGDAAGIRPAELAVRLWCDGEAYAEAALTALNGWTAEWENLPAGHDWVVSERPVPGYSLTVKQVGNVFLLTNTLDEAYLELDDPDVPHGRPDDPALPDSPDDPSDGLTDIPDPEVPHGTLAQTGLRWQPVLLLAGAGIVCCALGFLLLRRRGA